MYGELFNEAADEAAFSAFLGSPTRQAVALARAYNSKERKLQINSTSRADGGYEDDGDTIPVFIQIVERLREEAEDRGLLSAKPEMRSVWSEAPADLAPEIPFVPAVPAEPEEPVPENPVEKLEYVEPDETELKFDDLPPMPESILMESEPEEVTPVFSGRDSAKEKAEPERKLIVPLVILFAIFAIPITVLIICLLLIPTFVSLGLSAGCLFVGVKVAMSAFVGFSMFSDIMVVLGGGAIILALGLLFLWLFIWFIGGAITGLINAVLQLGGKWCSREVKK